MGYGLWIMGYGLWIMDYGLWVMGYGLWVMVCGLWVMVYGLWFMDYRSRGADCVDVYGLCGLCRCRVRTYVLDWDGRGRMGA